MLTEFQFITPQGANLSFPLDDSSGGFTVEDIDGLDPVSAIISESNFATVDGTQFQAARRASRNLIFTLGVDPAFMGQVRALRSLLYGFVMPKADVTIRFISDDMPDVEISGRVRDFNFPVFAKDPKATISIINFDPDFRELEEQVFEGETSPTTTGFDVDYNGSIETGVVMEFAIDRAVDNFHIEHRPADGTVRVLDLDYDLLAGDRFSFSSIPGDKYVRVLRNGETTFIAYAKSISSEWVYLYPGENNIRVFADGEGVPFTFKYTTKYGGL